MALGVVGLVTLGESPGHAAVAPVATAPARSASPTTAAAPTTVASPNTVASPTTTAAPAQPAATPPAAETAPAASTVASDPPPGTTYLPVSPGSGAGCTAGITEGNRWIKYTVQSGDSLSAIARCFDQNGYEALYEANASYIGGNPNLIYPGQVLTIVNGVMTAAAH